MQCGLLEYILWLFGFNTCCQNSSHNTLLLILGFEERRHIMLNHLLTLSSISKCRKLHTELTIRVNYFISIFLKYKNLSNIFCRKKYYVLFFKIPIVKNNDFTLQCQWKHIDNIWSRMEIHVDSLCIIKIILSHGH